MSASLPLNEKADVRAATRNASIFERALEQFFSQAVAEVFVLRIGAHIDERQNGDRGRRLRVPVGRRGGLKRFQVGGEVMRRCVAPFSIFLEAPENDTL